MHKNIKKALVMIFMAFSLCMNAAQNNQGSNQIAKPESYIRQFIKKTISSKKRAFLAGMITGTTTTIALLTLIMYYVKYQKMQNLKRILDSSDSKWT